MIGKITSLFDRCGDAVVAVREGRIEYYNGAAERLIPRIGETKPSDFLPAPALIEKAEDFRGEAIIAGQRMFVAASTIERSRVYIFSRISDECAETAELLSSAGTMLKDRLAVLKMAAELMLPYIEDSGSDSLTRYSAMISHCYHSMLRLANNLGGLGAIFRGDATLTMTAFDLVTSCRELAGTAAQLAADRAEIRFKSNAENLFILADRRRLETMLLNLLANSLQNAAHGGTITISVMSAVDRVVLSVGDNGGGIGGDVLPTVWVRYGVQKELSEWTGGLGLGLAIVQNTARLHGGSAILETRPGEGSIVTVSLPWEKPGTEDIIRNDHNEVVCGMELLLTELSGVLSYDKYTQLYVD